jgi:hypothetical protein
MPSDWKDLTRLSNGASLVVQRIRIPELDIAVEGEFELPALAQLSADDGSIKEMERLFGVSYPTIKNRLNRLGELLDLELGVQSAPTSRTEVLDKLERGDITAAEAAEALRQ